MRRARVSDYRFLFLALLAMALAAPLLGPGLYAMGALEISFALVLAAAVLGSDTGPGWRRLSLAVGGVAVGSMLASRWLGLGLPSAAESLLVAAFLLLTAGHVLRAVLRTTVIGSREIAGVLAVYLLLGLAWAEFYSIILDLDPASFHFPGADSGMAPTSAGEMSPAIGYFSFVTLTTLGYGDIVPVAPMARTLAWMEALLGQIFLAVVVARLVSLYTVSRPQREPEP